jgi:hypothetical protein
VGLGVLAMTTLTTTGALMGILLVTSLIFIVFGCNGIKITVFIYSLLLYYFGREFIKYYD